MISDEMIARTPGAVRWHSSEEGGGPDCGIEIGLGNGKALYIGEMAGHRAWQIALIDGEAMCALADVTNVDLASTMVEQIAATLRALKETADAP